MWDENLVKRLAARTLELLRQQGPACPYGDIRFVDQRSRSSSCTNGVAQSHSSEERGYGIRVMTRGDDGRQGWGFAATSLLDDDSLERTVVEALRNGRANQLFQPPSSPVVEFTGSAERGTFRSTVTVDPFDLPLTQIEARLLALDATMKRDRVIAREAFIAANRDDKWFFTTAGAELHQTLTFVGAMAKLTVSAPGVDHHQTRSYPGSAGNWATAGYEYIDALGLEEQVDRLYDEARTIITAPECPAARLPVVLGPQMLALLVHEVAGHALELDRALGVEAAYAGKSFLKTGNLGKLVYGAPIVNIVSDPTYPGAVATYGWDDEGTRAHCAPMVDNGVHVGYLSGRTNAGLVGLTSCAACRANGWDRQPIDRMTNVNLLPGTELTADDIVASVDDGLYLEVPCGWSINSDRNGFRFSVEICRRIEGGKLTSWLRNGAFRARTTPAFWATCRAIAKDAPFAAGFNNCAKGQPVQLQYTGHVVPMAVRFDDVEVGEHGSVD